MIPNAREFLKLLDNQNPMPNFRLGTITTASGRPTVQFDGEASAGSKQYPYLAPYTPTVGDRVLLCYTAGSYVILGKII